MLSFAAPSCLTTGICTNCGGCGFLRGVSNTTNDEYDPSKAPGQVATVLYEERGVATFYTGGKLHQPTVITYSFSGTLGADFSSDPWLISLKAEWGLGDKWIEYTNAQKAAIAQAAGIISAETGVELVYVSDPSKADMVWHYGSLKMLAMSAAFAPQNIAMGSDIIINTNYSLFFETVDRAPGGKGFAHLLHEFGHAIGMKHPFFGTNQLQFDKESRNTTVMSHTEDPTGRSATSLKPLDVQALTYLYGADSDKLAIMGADWSQLHGGGLITTGSAANDTLTGIADRDSISASAGNDLIYAAGGNDTIDGGSGENIIFGGAGFDVLRIKYLSAETAGHTLTWWDDPREKGAKTGIIHGEFGTTYFSGVNGFMYDKYTYNSTGKMDVISSDPAFIRNAYNLLYNRPETTSEFNVAKTFLATNSRVDFVEAKLAAMTMPDLATYISRALALTGPSPSLYAMSQLATKTGDVTSFVVAVSNGEVIYNGVNGAGTGIFNRAGNDIFDITTTIYRRAFGENNLHVDEIRAAADSIIASGKTYEDIAVAAIQKSGSSRSLDSILTGSGASRDHKPFLDIYNLDERDGSLGFSLRDNGNAVGYVRSFEITDIAVQGESLIINIGNSEAVRITLSDRIEIIDGVILTGFRGNASSLQFIYESLTGREASQATITALRNIAVGGGSYEANVKSMLHATDVAVGLGDATAGLSNTGFAVSLYRRIFGRDPSTEEAKQVVDLLNAGAARINVALEISGGSAARERLIAPSDGFKWLYDPYNATVDIMYDGAFNRMNEQLTETHYGERLKNGLTIDVLARILTNSEEMRVMKRAQLADSDYIQSQYWNSFDRAPTNAELNYWITQINAGIESRASLLSAATRYLLNEGGYSAYQRDFSGTTWINPDGSPSTALDNDALRTIRTGTTVSEKFQAGIWSDSVVGMGGNDSFEGSGGDDTLIAGSGNDLLDGGSGNDSLDGGVGTNMLIGGDGDDFYVIRSSTDFAMEAALGGSDTITTSIDFYLEANFEGLILDRLSGSRFGVGNNSANFILGNSDDNLIIAHSGNDTVDGGDGKDLIFGGEGNDNLVASDGIDYVSGGIGSDQVDGGNGADELHGEAGDDTLFGGIDFATDILVGGSGNDSLDGGIAWDLMYGGQGDDTYLVSQQVDWCFEMPGEGFDLVIADSPNGFYLHDDIENLALLGDTPFGVGNKIDNRITGSNSANWLLGGAGNDTLDSLGGNDVVFGQDGADIFIIRATSGVDIIGDFERGVDKIHLVGKGLTDLGKLMGNFSQVEEDSALNFGNGNHVILKGVQYSTLSIGDFVFG